MANRSAAAQPPALDAHDLLRALLGAYQAQFQEIDNRRFRLQFQRVLTRRFLTDHARGSATELQRVLHGQLAARGESRTREALLRDLQHFTTSLRPALSTFARTLIVLGIALVAQLLGRLPLIPIVSGPDRKPALGSLSDAVDLDPGHVAKALADLLSSPLSTICGAVATLSAAAVLVLGPTIPAFRNKRELVGAADYRRPHAPAERGSIEDLERRLFAAVSGSAPARRPFDLMICWSLAIFAIALGSAWYAAYVRGLFRETPSFLYSYRLGSRYPSAILRTDHPATLGVGGLAFIAAGIVVAIMLLRRQPGSPLRRRAWTSRSPFAKVLVAGGIPVALVFTLAASGGVAFELPWVHSYNDPLLTMRIPRTRALALVAQPVIPLSIYCHPQPCAVQKARISESNPMISSPLGPLPPGSEVSVGKTVPLLSDLPTEHPSGPVIVRRLGLPRGLPLNLIRLPAQRFQVKRTELVELTLPPSGRLQPGSVGRLDPSSAFVLDVLRHYSGFLPVALTGPNRLVRNVSRNTKLLAIVLGDRDLKHLLADLAQRRASSIASIDVTVLMGNKLKRDVRLPLLL